MLSTSFLATLEPLPHPYEVQQWDKAAHALGIPEAVLMENAAQAAFAVLRQYVSSLENKHVWLFMGSGNNGGDAACMARYVQDAGANPLILHCKPLNRYTGITARQIRIAKKLGIPFFKLRSPDLRSIPYPLPHILVDGLLGTGFHGPLKTETEQLVAAINNLRTGRFVLALDIPSGLDGLTGTPAPIAIKANATATFAARKPGIALPASVLWTGKVHRCSIGLPEVVRKQQPCSAWLLDRLCLDSLRVLPGQSYKNTFGHVYVIGGAEGLEGAAHLASRAALRTGAGLVTAVTHWRSAPLVKNGWAEIMTLSLTPDGENAWPETLPAELAQRLCLASSLVVGPGMGRSPGAGRLLKAILQLPNRPPTVIDADALMLLAHSRELLSAIRSHDVLTPHPGEAAALLGCDNVTVQRDRFGALKNLCELQAGCVVLKGAGTLVGQDGGPVLVSPCDIPQLAVGGSGDVLAGCAGALLARSERANALETIARAVMLHALAGKACAARFPLRGNRASEIADAIPGVLASLGNTTGNGNQQCDN